MGRELIRASIRSPYFLRIYAHVRIPFNLSPSIVTTQFCLTHFSFNCFCPMLLWLLITVLFYYFLLFFVIFFICNYLYKILYSIIVVYTRPTRLKDELASFYRQIGYLLMPNRLSLRPDVLSPKHPATHWDSIVRKLPKAIFTSPYRPILADVD